VFDKIQEGVDKGLNDKIQDSLNEGKKLLRKRMKLIKLADRENWVTVKAYVSDDMASDSEDEKRINRAIRTANSKIEKQRKLKRRGIPPRITFQDTRRLVRPNLGRFDTSKSKDLLSCWNCGRSGHFSMQCPFNKRKTFADFAVKKN